MGLGEIVKNIVSGTKYLAILGLSGIMTYGCGEYTTPKKPNPQDINSIKSTGRISFCSDRDDGQWDLYSITTKGEDLKRHTKTAGRESDPAISPDGKSLAFSMDGNLYILDTETNKSEQITSERYRDIQPAWHPDGKTIFFTRDFGGDDLELCVRDNEGTITQLTDNEPGIYDFAPSVSESGVAFVRRKMTKLANGNDAEDSNVWVMDFDGKNQDKLTDEEETISSPSFTPKGRIVYVNFGSERKVHSIKRNGRGRKRLMSDLPEELSPKTPLITNEGELIFAAASGGNRIRTTYHRDGRVERDSWDDYKSNICIRTSEGEVFNLTKNKANNESPTWNP